MSPLLEMQSIRGCLDQALLKLMAIAGPRNAIRNAEAELVRALKHMYRAQASQTEQAMFQTEYSAALEGTRRTLAVLQEQAAEEQGAAEAVALVDQALRNLLSLRQPTTEPEAQLARPGEKKSPLRASVEEPHLLDLPRWALQPTVPLPPLDEPPLVEAAEAVPEASVATSLEELRSLIEKMVAAAEPAEEKDEPPAEAGGKASATDDRSTEERNRAAERELFGTALREEEILFDRARTCLEDLATFSLMRKPLEGQSWVGRATTERRLLARIDAIFSLGEAVLPRLVRLLEDRPIPDPELAWAVLFLFGSVAGDDALDQVMRIARFVSLESSEMVEAVADALWLAPHPGIAAAIRPWLSDPDPARRVVALEILGRRRAITSAEALRCAGDPESSVVAAAARALGNSSGSLDQKALGELLRHPDETIVRAAMESSILRRSPLFIDRARKLIADGRPGFAQAAAFLAIGSEARDLDLFLTAADRQSSPELLEAAGWFGHVQLIDVLLRSLRASEEGIRLAAVGALQRITGASLTEDEPDPQYDPEERPFLRAFAPPPPTDQLSLDPEAWTAWWKKHQASCRSSSRYRYGHAWSPEDNLWQMEDPLAVRADRWRAHLELVARTGETIPFEPDAFVARQRKQIQEWRNVCNGRRHLSGTPGGWPLRLGG